MKVVLFCGGLGMRLRPLSPDPPQYWVNASLDVPKPMVHIGAKHPLLWHVMKYYAHYGHKDFVLCLGYKAESIKNYFLTYNEFLTNDFVFSKGGRGLSLLHRDISDWNITFVDTGLFSNIGERFMAVKDYVKDEDMFLANYSDGLSDLPLDEYIAKFQKSGCVGAFVCVKPPYTTHMVRFDSRDNVAGIDNIRASDMHINGGYFIFRKAIYDYIRPGEELVGEPLNRLIRAGKLMGYKYNGFWTCIDTFKEKQELDEMCARGDTPWQVWLHDHERSSRSRRRDSRKTHAAP